MTEKARRGRDVSNVLAEARTVYNRARTAKNKIEHDLAHGVATDPDVVDILGDLDRVIEIMAPWRRTGR